MGNKVYFLLHNKQSGAIDAFSKSHTSCIHLVSGECRWRANFSNGAEPGNRMEELYSLHHSNSNAALVKMLKRISAPSKSQATQVPYYIHSIIYNSSQQNTGEAFGDFFASALINGKNAANPCPTCLTTQSNSTNRFLSKYVCQVLLKTTLDLT